MNLEPQTKLEELQGKLYAKAKAEPKFRFYALYDKLYRADVLAAAYADSKSKGGAAGVDGQTFEQIEAYGVEKWLLELQQELREKTYRPLPVRRVTIPKPGGGERPLGIPVIKDRVVQRAAKSLLEPIFEADFKDSAFGYRPERSARDAVEKVDAELHQGKTKVVDADLSKYFDTIPHAELMTCIARRIADTTMLHLIKMWLKVPVEERDGKGPPRMTGGKSSKQGTPQGGVISPLLANIYINRLLKKFAADRRMQQMRATIVNYADDFVVLVSFRAEEVLGQLQRWLTGMKLTLNMDKTCLRDARREPFRFLGYEFGPLYSRKTGKRYIGVQPSNKALKHLRDEVSSTLDRRRTEHWSVIRDELNRQLRGWEHYFNYGSPSVAFHKMNVHVARRVRNFLRRRHRKPVSTPDYGFWDVFTRLKVRMLTAPRLSARPA